MKTNEREYLITSIEQLLLDCKDEELLLLIQSLLSTD